MASNPGQQRIIDGPMPLAALLPPDPDRARLDDEATPRAAYFRVLGAMRRRPRFFDWSARLDPTCSFPEPIAAVIGPASLWGLTWRAWAFIEADAKEALREALARLREAVLGLRDARPASAPLLALLAALEILLDLLVEPDARAWGSPGDVPPWRWIRTAGGQTATFTPRP